ncbi:MAG: chemotaxis response regulator protein-glutamate methylesterase [Ignavibacteriales bacterium]|nr:chemotaxis response regulator protein-glutamate methylesterase [Ignavibacteriales bacterium]
MITRKIKVLVVDDSAFMRKSLSMMLESDPEIEVIATARDGLEGIELAKRLSPDLITLDIEMPKMDGLTALQRIMAEHPTAVMMVSSLTTDGADATLKALELGAIDFIPKEMSFVSVNIVKIKLDLIQKVKSIVRQQEHKARLVRLREITHKIQVDVVPPTKSEKLPSKFYKAIALGISTGGPLSLQKVIPQLSKKVNCPIFIVQHMPPKFTKSLADRLNGLSALEVKEAENAETVKGGIVYIAPGGFHMHIENGSFSSIKIRISEEPADTLHRPSVDVMMDSVVKVYGKSTLGIIMTGMGKDGFEAMKELKSLGGNTIAQDEDSSVVYGMPKAIVDGGLADLILPLERISEIINMAF